MSLSELRWLAQAARGCRVIVEVGSYKGRSTRALADHCPGTVFAVDPWDGGYVNDDDTQARWLDTRQAREQFQRNLDDHLRTGRVVQLVHFFNAGGAQAIEDWLGGPGRADLIFIDGDHRFEMVLEDIAHARRLARLGGIIAGHDFTHVSWPGVARAVKREFPNHNLCDSIWWVRHKEAEGAVFKTAGGATA
jgi:predicted O-methyltransferase YrrM